MSYADVIAGLHERFATVPGIKAILAYEPPSIQVFPTLYSMPTSGTRNGATGGNPQGQVVSMDYETVHRLVFRWQDQKTAFSELWPFINSLPAAVDQDPRLGGRIANGYARMLRYETTFVTIGGVEYLCLEWYSSVPEKGVYKDGIL
ncbi:MAG TPA: hypothetical protein VFT66_15645 [Roseiflexaceae bacterium]|nr:hypothetical protein [Roseiflexaceae bacterium]